MLPNYTPQIFTPEQKIYYSLTDKDVIERGKYRAKPMDNSIENCIKGSVKSDFHPDFLSEGDTAYFFFVFCSSEEVKRNENIFVSFDISSKKTLIQTYMLLSA